ncbi:MAG: F0F1 ATP synthase subunit B [Immundisolibacteraceae bacterium]|nr:F0F1 ATP synthase subunit B [Immundisolibacteraceae bacterium]
MGVNATLLGQMITFILFVLFTMKFVWPPLTAAMAERAERIADGLAAAEKGQQAGEEAKVQVEAALNEARTEAAALIAQAQKRHNDVVDEAKGVAAEEGSRILEAARAQIEQETTLARETLRKQVAVLAVAGAEKILVREIDAAGHEQMLNELAGQL